MGELDPERYIAVPDMDTSPMSPPYSPAYIELDRRCSALSWTDVKAQGAFGDEIDRALTDGELNNLEYFHLNFQLSRMMSKAFFATHQQVVDGDENDKPGLQGLYRHLCIQHERRRVSRQGSGYGGVRELRSRLGRGPAARF